MFQYSNLKIVYSKKKIEVYKIKSIYNYEKINSLFKNFDTMSFLDLIVNYKQLINNGYNKIFLNQSLLHAIFAIFLIFNDGTCVHSYS